MSKLPIPRFEMQCWIGSMGGLIFYSSRWNYECFFQSLFRFILEYCIFDLCTIVLMKGFSLRLFFGPLSYGGSYKITVFLSLCWSVSPSAVQNLTQEWVFNFFLIFCIMVYDWNIQKLAECFFQENSFFLSFGQNNAQNGSKIEFCHRFFLEIF